MYYSLCTLICSATQFCLCWVAWLNSNEINLMEWKDPENLRLHFLMACHNKTEFQLVY